MSLMLLAMMGLVALIAAAPSPAAAKPPAKAPKVKLKIQTGSQQAALNSKVIRVRVRSTGKAVVKLNGPLVKAKQVRFERNRKVARTVKLGIRPAGWEQLATCGAKTVRVNGKFRQRVRKRVVRRRNGRKVVRYRTVGRQATSKANRKLSRLNSLCNKPPACDSLDGAACLLPWPNDHFTRPDASTETGLRLDLPESGMPVNRSAKPIDPEAWNQADGFSIGQPIMVRVPGLETEAAVTATDPPTITRIADYEYPDSPVVLIEATTGERVPIWVELDSTAVQDNSRVLLIHPAESLKPATRYIVAMRDLVTGAGQPIAPGENFRNLRDRKVTATGPSASQISRYSRIFKELNRAGIGRSDLYLAWDFTVASEQNLTGRMLSIRDRAFAALGDTDLADRTVQGDSPGFTVTQVKTFTVGQNPRIAREVRGTIDVPCFLWPDCEMQTGPDPAGSFKLDPQGLPEENTANPMAAKFTCIVPRASETEAARPMLYGHGLFSSLEEVTIRPHQNLAQDHDMVLCATDQISLTTAEQLHVIGIVSDFSRFPEIADGLQQGMLNELLLGRAMIHPQGFTTHAAFRAGNDEAGGPVIDPDATLSYSGYSMGGIMGGMLAAVAPDFERAVLGVPGQRFSVLLPRSSYWSVFGSLIKTAYPNDIDASLAVSLLQNLWDRGEANGYAHTLAGEPLPNTPQHQVLLSSAFGDWQVSNWATLLLARTVRAAVRQPLLDPGRWTADAMWGVPNIGLWPHQGSAMTMWDIGQLRGDPEVGVGPPPLGNVPNGVEPYERGEDPHDMIWDMPAERASVSQFVEPGDGFTDPCPTSTPCYAGTWTGPGGP